VIEKQKRSILRHLKRHGLDGRWIRQRKMRDCIHAEDAKAFNQAVVELAMDGVVQLDVCGPFRQKVIRLKTADDELPTANEMPTVSEVLH